ncbi:peptidoglycan/LPS O-acetylase OafA/YrhL [Hoeflea halophila]|uniref:Peptidoglycan/LPS O-acetylase OafA/YrhL n=1 Tax=Hoeflea halophila TaxID=714899 RepID=A0A286IFK3_9HYPH|nr:acyltransferase [Hoeflea halophila]SOE18807.1 peptidoglycan/LPS O-acetylase OafA/YrhL [Hoeflea halophila]
MREDQPTSLEDQNGSRNGLLDLLRFSTALMLAFYHFLYRGALDGGYLDHAFGSAGIAVSLGYLGVNLFFMISGFVIIWSASGRDWYGFSVGRLARLYPAHLVAMTITFLVMLWWAQPPYQTGISQWLANLTMLAPLFGTDFMDGAYWSIVIEIIFYGWVAIGLFSGFIPRHTDAAVAIWMLLVMINNTMLGSRPVELLFLTEYGSYFAFGAMTWRISSQGTSNLRLLVAALALLMTFHAAEVQRLDVIFRLGEASSAPLVALANAGIIGLFLLAAGLGRHIKAGPWVLALGGISYPFYLIHQNAGYILINVTAPAIGKWNAVALALVLTIATSWWIYARIEPVGRAIIRRLFSPVASYLPRTFNRYPAPAEQWR